MKKEKKKIEEKKLHNSNFLDAVHNATNGLIYATTTQSNIKKQLVIAVIVMILSLFFDLETSEFLCLVFAVILVILAEMINTAIETLVDLYIDVYHPKAKIAKDVGAGAVLVTSFNGIIVAYFLFFQRVGNIGTQMIESIISSPANTAFVAMVLVVIAVIVVKAIKISINHKKVSKDGEDGKEVIGQEIKAFVPSGQAAISFAALIAIWITSKDVVVVVLALVLSLLVVVNRRSQNMRTFAEILFGAFMGILIVLMVYYLVMKASGLGISLIS